MTKTASRPPLAALLSVGFAIWLGFTVIVRLVGQWVFVPDQPLITILVFAVFIPVQFYLVRLLLDVFKVEPRQRLWAATWMLLLPLLLDGPSIALAGLLFPNLSAEAALLYGGLLLTLYAVGFWSALTYSSDRP
ncbi:MAG: DUF5367 family protein [Meiothermus sp.]|nr:DUF5367 family protein [Meiothermus sp.]